MAIKPLPSRDLVRQLLRYEPATGELTWLPRPQEMFKRHRQFLNWNARYPGNPAGSISHYGYVVLHFMAPFSKRHPSGSGCVCPRRPSPRD